MDEARLDQEANVYLIARGLQTGLWPVCGMDDLAGRCRVPEQLYCPFCSYPLDGWQDGSDVLPCYVCQEPVAGVTLYGLEGPESL